MKKLLIFALILTLALCVAACDKTPEETPTEAPTEAVTDAPTEEATTEEATTEEATTEEATTEEATTEEATTEEVTTEEVTTEEVTTEEATTEGPAEPAEPTALYTAEQLAALTAINATVTLEGEYAHFLTGTADTVTNPSITLTAPEGGFTDIIAIKYRTNCGSYGSNFWGTFLLNGTNEFYGNRRDSDNWFFYYTDGEWDVLILDMRKHKQGSDGTPDTDVTGGAAIESLVYNFFDYTGNDGKLDTYDLGDEYIDIEYIAFFNTKEEAQSYAG